MVGSIRLCPRPRLVRVARQVSGRPATGRTQRMSENNENTEQDVEPDDEARREQARERVESMPAETALGNADPAGGGKGDPKDVKPEGN